MLVVKHDDDYIANISILAVSTFWVVLHSPVSTKLGRPLRVVSTLWGVIHTGRYRTPNTAAAKLTVAIGTWAHDGTTQVQVVANGATVRSRRPIAAVATSSIRRRVTEVAGVEEVNWEFTPTQRIC